MKRAVLAILATAAGLVFVLSFRPTSVIAEPPPTAIVTPAAKPKLPLLKGKGALPAGPELDLAGLADGRHPSEPVEVPGGHGQLRLTLTVAGGRVVDLATAHEPTSPHSAQVSRQALPLLRAELLTTQHAPVDVVSGATAISQAFNAALDSATGPL